MFGLPRAAVAKPMTAAERAALEPRVRESGLKLLKGAPVWTAMCWLVWRRVEELRGSEAMGLYLAAAGVALAFFPVPWVARFWLLLRDRRVGLVSEGVARVLEKRFSKSRRGEITRLLTLDPPMPARVVAVSAEVYERAELGREATIRFFTASGDVLSLAHPARLP